MTVFYLQRRYDVDEMLCPPVHRYQTAKGRGNVGPIALKRNEMNIKMTLERGCTTAGDSAVTVVSTKAHQPVSQPNLDGVASR
jgi:hypothetical protein